MTMYVRTVVPMTITISSQDRDDDIVLDSRSPYKVLPLWAAQRLEFQELWTANKVQVATDTSFTNIITSIPLSEAETRSIETLTNTKTFGAISKHYIVLIGAGGVPTLPTAIGNTSLYTFKNIHSSTRTVLTTSSQTIDGATSCVLSANASIELVSDNSNWRVI